MGHFGYSKARKNCPSWLIQRSERRERTYGLTSEPRGNILFRAREAVLTYRPLI